MLLNKEQVMNFLPHREPFLFIDSVESVSSDKEPGENGYLSQKELAGAKVVAHYRTLKDHPIFAGHFPGNPILPGVVQVEMMAQASSFIFALTQDIATKSNLDVALVGITNAKFRKPILPEMDLRIETVCSKMRGPMIASDCKIYCGEDLLSEVSVLASAKL